MVKQYARDTLLPSAQKHINIFFHGDDAHRKVALQDPSVGDAQPCFTIYEDIIKEDHNGFLQVGLEYFIH